MTENQATTSEAADILVVDDNIASLRRLAETLSQEGHRVRQANSPDVALQAALAYPPDLILLGITMPDMSGFEVCRRLKQDKRTRDVPVIFMSSSQDLDVEDKMHSFEVGGVDFVSTCCHESVVLARVRTHLQLRRTQLQLEALVAERTAELRAAKQALEKEIQERARSQQALAESEQRYRALVEQAQDGIVLLQDGKIRFANSYIAGLLGYDTEELLGSPFEMYVPADIAQGVTDRYRKRIGGEAVPSVYELALRHQDGSRVEVEVNAGLTRYEGKDADLVFIRDIRERVKARQELEESQRLLNLVIDHVPALISYVDRHQCYRFVNLRYEQAYGVPRSQFVGKYVQEILGPEGYAVAAGQIDAALAGETVSYEDVFEYAAIGRRWMSVEYVPDRGPTGDVQGFVSMIRDITDRVEAEQALANSEAHLRRAQEVAQAGSWELDLIRGELFWSDEVYRIFGLSRETKMDYEIFLNCVMPEDRDYVNERWQAALAGAPYDIEHRIRAGDGVKWVREKAEVAFDGAGRAIRGTGIVIDVTESKLVEEQILEYQQRLQTLASQLTLIEERERRRIARELHDEVGQRLTFARMALASAQQATSEAQRQILLDDVSQSVRQAIGDIRDLVFDLSSPLMNEVGLAAALEEWLENQVGKKHGIRVKLIHDGRRLPLDDDVRAMLFRSARVLLTNVVKHAQASSVIVHLEGEGSMVRVTVEDDGIGFDVDALPKGTERGSGFGLFSIQERMAALGGSLELVSGPGQGCKAILTTPATLQAGAGKT
jgi:PAS domain S-box-containing protein